MIFSSGIFIAFLAVFLVTYSLFRVPLVRSFIIAVFSIIFYATWNYKLIWIVIFPTVVDYLLAQRIEKANIKSRRKAWLVLSLCFNLGLLFYFKYLNFFIDNSNLISTQIYGKQLFSFVEIILPVGISFYTFESISYMVDVYRGEIKSCKNFLEYFGYIVFFPKFVAGPIVRYIEYDKEFRSVISSRITSEDFTIGLQRFIEGFFKKVFLADQLALISDKVFSNPSTDTASAWIGLLAYSFQIYYDFSGYSDMGIGISRMIGLKLPENFDRPYHSKNIQEFWHKWHMTLSRWLRDYLYISLGGNRRGSQRTKLNLLITMLLGGLWHGASWNFVIWGGIHGVLLLTHRSKWFRKISIALETRMPEKVFEKSGVVFTFLMVAFAWVFFRAQSLDDSLNYFASLFGLVHHPVNSINPFVEQIFADQKFSIDKQLIYSIFILGLVLIYQFSGEHFNYRKRVISPSAFKIIGFYVSMIILMLIFTFPSAQKTFIYFQF